MVVIMFFRACAAWIFIAVYWIVVLIIHLATLRGIPDEWLAPMIRFWARTVLWIVGIKLESVNESTLQGRAPRVVIVNHQSALELVWGAAIIPPGFLAIGKKEIIYVPVMNLIWWGLRLIRIDRSNHIKAVAALSGVAQEIARNKRSLFVAPEGTRSRNGEIGPFKKGAFRIALEAGASIHPVVVSGAYDLLPRGRFVPRKGTLRIRFLPPVSPQSSRSPDGSVSSEFIEKVRSDMIACEKELRSRTDRASFS